MSDDELTLCCLLWAHAGAEADLVVYEDEVLSFLADHGIELIARAVGDGAGGQPTETQLYRVPDQAALDSFISDPRREALAAERDRVIARTSLFAVSLR